MNMEIRDLRNAVNAVLDEADHAADPLNGGLFDRTDLQRLVGDLRRTLESLEQAYEVLEAENRRLTERLCRSNRRVVTRIEHVLSGGVRPEPTQ